MRLTCPSCAAIYEVEDVAIPASGRRVRCGACDESWRVSGDGAPRRINPPPIGIPPSMSGSAARMEKTAPPELDAPETPETGSPAPETPAPEIPAPAAAKPDEAGKTPAPAPAASAPAATKPPARPGDRKAEKSAALVEKKKTAAAGRDEARDLSAGPAQAAMRSVMGFLLGFAVVVLIFAPYLFRPQIVGAFPAAEPAVDAYNGVLRKAPDALKSGYDYVVGEVGYMLGGLSIEGEGDAEQSQGGGSQ